MPAAERNPAAPAYSYNAAGQLAMDVVTRGGQHDQRTTYAYDAHGRLVKALTLGARSDTAGLSQYRYNAQGALAEEFLFQGHDASPLAPTTREAHFFTSRFEYAPNGQLRRVTTADVYVAATCGLDCPTWREEHGKQTVYRYNPKGYVAEEVTTVLRDQEVSRKQYRYAYQFWQAP